MNLAVREAAPSDLETILALAAEDSPHHFDVACAPAPSTNASATKRAMSG